MGGNGGSEAVWGRLGAMRLVIKRAMKRVMMAAMKLALKLAMSLAGSLGPAELMGVSLVEEQ